MADVVCDFCLLKGDQVLLHLRDAKPNITYPNMWVLPGGALEKGETAEQGAVRELFEETGYRAKSCQSLGEFPFFLAGKRKTVSVFWATYQPGQKIQCFEGAEMRWVNIKEAVKLKAPPIIRRILRFLQNEVLKWEP